MQTFNYHAQKYFKYRIYIKLINKSPQELIKVWDSFKFKPYTLNSRVFSPFRTPPLDNLQAHGEQERAPI